MAVQRKKKYRRLADRFYTYGYSRDFLGDVPGATVATAGDADPAAHGERASDDVPITPNDGRTIIPVAADGPSAECLYGLDLNARRCQAIIGSQFYRAYFFLHSLGFGIDDEIADALATREEEIPMVKLQYESAARSAHRERERGMGIGRFDV